MTTKSTATLPLQLRPISLPRVWGSRALFRRFGKVEPEGDLPLGESWEASDLPGLESVVEGGSWHGFPVTKALGEPLPLLVKLINTGEWLSLQVHPDEECCQVLGEGAKPKHEVWHIIDADPDAQIIHGTEVEIDPLSLIDTCRRGEVDGVLRRFPVHTGDTINIPAGTVHAIGPGITLYEAQQPSDTTYRLFDWGRNRKLHLDEASYALKPVTTKRPIVPTGLTAGPNPRIPLIHTRQIQLELLLVDRGDRMLAPHPTPVFVTAVGGYGHVGTRGGGVNILAGDTVVIPSHIACTVRGGDRGLRLLVASSGLSPV